jgi:8-amino-7-oxononanoate synthase
MASAWSAAARLEFSCTGKADVPLQMGTLSKALGAWRLYLRFGRGHRSVRSRARTLIYSTGSPPAIVAAADAALQLVERDPVYAARPLAKARAFTRNAGLPEPESPIVPVILGTAEAAIEAAQLLEEHGFLVAAIRPPTVPRGTARLRLTFTAQHPDDEVERLAEVVRTCILAQLMPDSATDESAIAAQ